VASLPAPSTTRSRSSSQRKSKHLSTNDQLSAGSATRARDIIFDREPAGLGAGLYTAKHRRSCSAQPCQTACIKRERPVSPFSSDRENPRLSLDRDPARFREAVDALAPAETAVTGGADPSEGHLRLVVHSRPVDMADPRVDLARYAQPSRGVAGEYSG